MSAWFLLTKMLPATAAHLANTMTHIIMTYIAEALAVVLILLLGVAILSI
jgi:hypothetical protein